MKDSDSIKQFTTNFLDFMKNITYPSSFCHYCREILNSNGFDEIIEGELPESIPKYGYFIRNEKFIIIYKIFYY